MQEPEIYVKLTEIFHDVFDNPAITLRPETTAADVPGWDSLNHINLIIGIEAEFEIKFSTEDLEAIEDVGAMVTLIQGKLAGQGR